MEEVNTRWRIMVMVLIVTLYGWVGHVVGVGDKRNVYKVLAG
jgi:hypothetical protein